MKTYYIIQNIFLDEIGTAGQELLSNSSVTIFGLGDWAHYFLCMLHLAV
ncbi:MAG: hypothetical protein CM15mP93_09340 [Thiotrichaceae bacterium]|nr:MAG: hypothetical protein CM15mP93_09340 [Thiotrichaceae bacterium]